MVPGSIISHVVPKSTERSTTPFSPAASDTPFFIAVPYRTFVILVVCSTQFIPLFVVLIISPSSPTIDTVVGFSNFTAYSFSSGFCENIAVDSTSKRVKDLKVSVNIFVSSV